MGGGAEEVECGASQEFEFGEEGEQRAGRGAEGDFAVEAEAAQERRVEHKLDAVDLLPIGVDLGGEGRMEEETGDFIFVLVGHEVEEGAFGGGGEIGAGRTEGGESSFEAGGPGGVLVGGEFGDALGVGEGGGGSGLSGSGLAAPVASAGEGGKIAIYFHIIQADG